MSWNFLYLVEEGKVASFLLATTVVTKLQYLSMKKKMLLEVGILYLVVVTFCTNLKIFYRMLNVRFYGLKIFRKKDIKVLILSILYF